MVAIYNTYITNGDFENDIKNRDNQNRFNLFKDVFNKISKKHKNT